MFYFANNLFLVLSYLTVFDNPALLRPLSRWAPPPSENQPPVMIQLQVKAVTIFQLEIASVLNIFLYVSSIDTVITRKLF